jgi:hypothetical protein
MSNYKRKEVMDYLTRKPLSEQDLQMAYEAGQQTLDSIPETQVASGEERVLNTQPFYQQPQQLIQDDIARPQVDDIPLYQGVQPNVAIKETMPTYVPPDMAPVMPQAPGVPDPQYRQIELATGGRVNFNEGSKLTGTDKTLEQNIKQDHKAYNDYRKSIGSPTIPLDNEYIRMWIRSRLSSGGPANKQPQKIIPLNLESVAFKLFQEKLDNLSYNQKQTVYDYIEDNRNKKATGGRVNLANGTEEPYNPEIPSLGFSDPIDILEQRLINEKDSTKVGALSHLLENAKKERKAKEIEREEFKKSQKEKGIKYKEDFPSEAAYFAETGKQLLTNPKYTLGSFGKGAVQGTEWLVGQPLKILFDQEGKNFEFYEPVLTKKLGIDKFVEENIPKGATTGTLFGGETIKTIGEFADPFLAYGLAKGAIKGAKPKPPTTAVDETIDPTRRDILKTGAVMGTGAALYPIAKNINILEDLGKIVPKKAPLVNIVRPLGATETKFPEWFPSLVNRIRKEGDMKPIYRTEKIPITEKEFNEAIKKNEKVKGEKFYANPRTEEYFRQNPNEFPYFKTKETEDIIGYEYTDKNLSDVKVVEVEGKEASVFFKNYYGAQVEMNYKSPSVMDDGSFYVKDYQPEAGSALDSAPDFEETFVKDIDEVLGGSSQLEKYATKSKKARYTKGEAIADEMEGRAQMELDRLKDEGILE